jgi:hypothetical protein
LLTAKNFLKYLIFKEVNYVPCFLAEYKKSFAEWGLGQLMTLHSQTYPQLLGISRRNGVISSLALQRGAGQNCGLMFHQG